MQDEQSFQNFEGSFENNQQANYPKLNYMQQNQPPRDQRQRDRDMDQMQPPPPMRDGRPPRDRDNQPMQPPPPPMRDGRPIQPPPPPFRDGRPTQPPPPPFGGGGRPPEPPEFEPPQPPAPRMAPPSFAPQFPTWQDSRGIRVCLNRVTFIWLNNGNSFWFFPTFIGRQAIVGFRWRGFGWTYQRINRNRIRSFQCF